MSRKNLTVAIPPRPSISVSMFARSPDSPTHFGVSPSYDTRGNRETPPQHSRTSSLSSQHELDNEEGAGPRTRRRSLGSVNLNNVMGGSGGSTAVTNATVAEAAEAALSEPALSEPDDVETDANNTEKAPKRRQRTRRRSFTDIFQVLHQATSATSPGPTITTNPRYAHSPITPLSSDRSPTTPTPASMQFRLSPSSTSKGSLPTTPLTPPLPPSPSPLGLARSSSPPSPPPRANRTAFGTTTATTLMSPLRYKALVNTQRANSGDRNSSPLSPTSPLSPSQVVRKNGHTGIGALYAGGGRFAKGERVRRRSFCEEEEGRAMRELRGEEDRRGRIQSARITGSSKWDIPMKGPLDSPGLGRNRLGSKASSSGSLDDSSQCSFTAVNEFMTEEGREKEKKLARGQINLDMGGLGGRRVREQRGLSAPGGTIHTQNSFDQEDVSPPTPDSPVVTTGSDDARSQGPRSQAMSFRTRKTNSLGRRQRDLQAFDKPLLNSPNVYDLGFAGLSVAGEERGGRRGRMKTDKEIDYGQRSSMASMASVDSSTGRDASADNLVDPVEKKRIDRMKYRQMRNTFELGFLDEEGLNDAEGPGPRAGRGHVRTSSKNAFQLMDTIEALRSPAPRSVGGAAPESEDDMQERDSFLERGSMFDDGGLSDSDISAALSPPHQFFGGFDDLEGSAFEKSS